MLEALLIIGVVALFITILLIYLRNSKKIKLENKAKEEKVEKPEIEPEVHNIETTEPVNIVKYVEEQPHITFINTPPPEKKQEPEPKTPIIKDKEFHYSDNFFGVDVGEEQTPKQKTIAQQISELSPELKAIS